jgi:Zn finger protein HypA/HybF involved in hydrogenase expression
LFYWIFWGLVVEVVVESMCIDCNWKGAESEHHFLDGWHVCPECHQAEFLVSGDELDEMNEREVL